MAQAHKTPMFRIDARIPLAVRETIDRAAAMQGRTRTDFLIEAALEKAEQVIAEQSIIRLTMRDQELPAEALQNQRLCYTRQLTDSSFIPSGAKRKTGAGAGGSR